MCQANIWTTTSTRREGRNVAFRFDECDVPKRDDRSATPMNNAAATEIVILGGGFAGLYAALELEKTLARDPQVEITLINRENFFLFTPMLHEVAASDLDITAIVNPLRKMLKRIRF